MRGNMRCSSKAALISGVILAGTAFAASPASASAAPAASVNCSWSPANNSKAPGMFQQQGVNIRSGPSTSCDVIRGEGYEGQSVTIHCGTGTAQNQVWLYLTDNTTGVTGWSEAPLAQIGNGYSVVAC
jgi:hypothetical protein